MTARDHALLSLDSLRLPGWRAHTLKRSPDAQLDDPRDQALAENLRIGVIKNLLHLQHLIAHYSKRNLKSIDAPVQKILAIALYQLRFLSRVPQSAAVNEAVKQTHTFSLGRASAFVNAVLRNATRDPNPPLPDESNPAEYARIVLSHAPELFNKLLTLTDPTTALAISRHNNSTPPTILRLSPGVECSQLQGTNVTITPHSTPGFCLIDPAIPSVLSDLASGNLAQVQDPISASIVPRLDLKPGLTILDRCCGVGTKTLQIHQLAGPSSIIFAIDPNDQRLAVLNRSIQSRNLQNIKTFRASFISELAAEIPATFDRILIDAPCSNSGVLARRPEARYHQDEKSLRSLVKLQTDILSDTIPNLSPGGLLLYSTCSIWPEENQQLIDSLLPNHPHLQKLDEKTILPSTSDNPTEYHDGGYYTLLRSS